MKAVRLSHTLFLSEELAWDALAQLKNPSGNMVSFETLTKLIRHCSYTEEKAENIGWINTDILDDVSSINSSEEDENPLEELLPFFPR